MQNYQDMIAAAGPPHGLKFTYSAQLRCGLHLRYSSPPETKQPKTTRIAYEYTIQAYDLYQQFFPD